MNNTLCKKKKYRHDSLISVIIPVYNVERYLPRCLNSISEQTYRNLEIILVDDGSTDRSGTLCNEFAVKDCRARVIHQPNTGLWAARNTGHDAAHGEYLFFPDADDYFHFDTLRLLFEAINSGSGYDLAICRKKKTDKDDEDVSSNICPSLLEITRDDLFHDLFENSSDTRFSVYMWNKLFRSTLITDFRSNNYARAQDMDYMIRLFLMVDRAILVNTTLYYWYQHPESLMHSNNYWLLFHECRARMFFRNYTNWPEHGHVYSHYLLEGLYTRMIFWKALSLNQSFQKDTFSECAQMIDLTQKDFLHCRIIPLFKRIICFILVHNPRLARYLMVVTKNI